VRPAGGKSGLAPAAGSDGQAGAGDVADTEALGELEQGGGALAPVRFGVAVAQPRAFVALR
jgi:hypothetical protein